MKQAHIYTDHLLLIIVVSLIHLSGPVHYEFLASSQYIIVLLEICVLRYTRSCRK